MNKVGNIPEFENAGSSPTSAGGLTLEEQQELASKGYGVPEVSVISAEKPAKPNAGEEKEIPSEPPAETTPDEEPEKEPVQDTGELEKQELAKAVDGLKREKRNLILELNDLRGERRQSKKLEIEQVQDKIDDLKDLNPQDVETIDRIMKAKGYVSQESINHMFYQNRKQEEIARFLNEFREYNEENDPEGKKFGPLLQEVKLYKEPQDPSMYGILLRRAHKMLNGNQVSSERGTQAKQRQVKVASVGSGGSQRSSSAKSFNDRYKDELLRGGWSEEDIQRMEQRL